MWNQQAAKPQRILQFINFAFFIVPFACDGYFLPKYLLMAPEELHTEEHDKVLNDFNMSLAITGLVIQYIFLAIEMVKLIASNRNKYQ